MNNGLNANVRVAPARTTVLPNCERRSGWGNVTLGPPTLEQSEEIADQREKDPDEFWQLAAASAAATVAAGDTRKPPKPKLLEGAAPEGLWDALAEHITERGFDLRLVSNAAAIGGTNGLTDFMTRSVSVRVDMDDAAMVRTLAHEEAVVADRRRALGLRHPLRQDDDVHTVDLRYELTSAPYPEATPRPARSRACEPSRHAGMKPRLVHR